MIRFNTFFARSVAVVCCVTLVNMAVPMGIPWFVRQSLPKGSPFTAAPKKELPKASRPLSAKEMSKQQGKFDRNPYLAGSGKWDPMYKGVDLITRNYTTSATDLNFEGGYGIPVNVTRSYSANNAEQGPFGEGWELSADGRTTAGGLLKSSGAPIRSVPNLIKNRPSTQTDPGLASANEPVEAVTGTDASGKEETLQRDVDGVITTPPWDTNIVENHYVSYTDSTGGQWQLVDSSKVTTVEGTVYQYSNEGFYCDSSNNMSGMTSFSNPSATPEPSYVLKITSATDRQGNETDYTYSTDYVNFTKLNGTTREHRLTKVHMPNGHAINLTWGDGSTGLPVDRVAAVDDKSDGQSSASRTVYYTYDSNKLLASASSPTDQARSGSYATTTYGYGSSSNTLGSGDTAGALLTSITDPRGLTTTIDYMMDSTYVLPYDYSCYGPCVWRIVAPNGIYTYIVPYTSNLPTGFGDLANGAQYDVFERVGGPHGALIADFNSGGGDQGDGTCRVFMKNWLLTPLVGTNTFFTWWKYYDINTQSLVTDIEKTYPSAGTHYQSLAANRFGNDMAPGVQPVTQTTTTMSYNFMGNPLTKTVDEAFFGTGWPSIATKETDYAYWGADKYFQQKAVRMKTGGSSWRYSFTDYFDNTSATGAKGQTKAVYSPAFSSFDNTSGTDWQYNIVPHDTSTAAAKFYDSSGNPAYDSKGRVLNIWKLQKTTTSPWTYVRTHTTYGSDTDGSWGQAASVEEDADGYDRTTQTLDYTSWGQADKVQDAANHVFETHYFPDGRIDWVKREDVTPNVTLASYTYDTTAGITYQQPTQIVDGLSGVTQNFSYCNSGGGLGQVSQVQEVRGSNTYTTDYSYNSLGCREYATYTTPSGGSTQWWYHDYIQVGSPEKANQAFQTLTKMKVESGNWVASNDEMHYGYDAAGRLRVASFAQTPLSTGRLSNNTYYDYSSTTTWASSRARAVYVYDPSGRTLSVDHYWDHPNTGGSGYLTDYLLGNSCDYLDYTGLKNTSTFWIQGTGGTAVKDKIGTSDHVETYAYDANLDYLTSAQYVTGGANTTWSYDAAGNRTLINSSTDCASIDNLNRAGSIQGVSRTYDILGNTTAIGSKGMVWDCLNRMIGYTNGTHSITNTYRADGMRVVKASTLTPSVHTDYGYDGQMPIEEYNYRTGYPASAPIKLIRYGLGARGVDWIERTDANTNVVTTGYPIYDAHGNMVATLEKVPTDSWAINDQRNYDAWGGILAGNTTGEPNGRYCANLGHLQDDESGFTYMRARFYDPNCGRFLSEDPAADGPNWFIYCQNDPIGHVDSTGRWVWAAISIFLTFLLWGCPEPKTAAGALVKRIAEAALVAMAAIDLLCDIAKRSGPFERMMSPVWTLVGCGASAIAGIVALANISLLMVLQGIDDPDRYDKASTQILEKGMYAPFTMDWDQF